jgi:hypothetical protein
LILSKLGTAFFPKEKKEEVMCGRKVLLAAGERGTASNPNFIENNRGRLSEPYSMAGK